MHTNQAFLGARVAIYARFSTDRQRDTSIDDQVRRCRQYIAESGGDSSQATVFSDFAISGSSLDRPGFEAMMQAVEEKRIDAIVTEDISRISRDFADSAMVFKRLQFAQIPLIGVADGINTGNRDAKLSFTLKSLVADLYLDDLRDKTLRGLEGRALSGYATGNTPFGYRTVPELDGSGRILGHRIEIDPEPAAIIRRIFHDYLEGGSLCSIAIALNRADIPSPRVGTRHKRFGWGPSTIRAILYNTKYVGTWKFKERQWVKVPGSNKRAPRMRDPKDIISQERPELRIIDAQVWEETQARLNRTKRRYTKKSRESVTPRGRKSGYVLSGILFCDHCSAPMVIYGGGTGPTYYRCSNNRNRGTCDNRKGIREEIIRRDVLGAIRDRLRSPEAITYVRKRIAEELGDYSRKLETEFKERQERLIRTEERIQGLISFIADGDRSDYIVATLRDLEAHAKSEKAAIERIKDEIAQPLRLPSVDELANMAFDLEARLTKDPQAGRMQLQRWLTQVQIRVRTNPDGSWSAHGDLLPLVILTENENPGPKPGASLNNICSGGKI